MGQGFNLDAWWDELAYRKAMQGSLTDQGSFILRKLSEHDPIRFKTVMADLYRDEPPDPGDITEFQWRASDEEIKDVQLRMGRVWR